ncbi:MAG: acyltransferase [Acidimicrobiales bacterium]
MAQTARDRSETTGPVPPRRHFPGFEALRAVAAAMVVVHHASALSGPARAGRLATPAAVMDGGVAIFFVLSGFLIYRPFAAAAIDDRPHPSWRSFWWRRALRIVPAYWVALTFFWVAGAFELGPNWWRYYLFLQIYDRYTSFGGIVQAWSLCTEVSFYLLVPLWASALALAARRARRTAPVAAHLAGCAVLWLAGVAGRVAMERWWPSRRGISFNWLITNLDLFASGMALAVVSAWASTSPELAARLDRWARSVWPYWLAAVALFAWYAYRVGPVPFDPGYTGWFWHRRQFTLAAISVLLMFPAVFGPATGGWARRAWSARPLVWVGTVSYGWYLWHFDWMKRAVSAPGRPGWDPALAGEAPFVYVLAVGVVLGLGCAALSWHLLERPLQRWKDLGRARPGALGGPNRAQ